MSTSKASHGGKTEMEDQLVSRKLWWMLLTLMAPAVVVGMALEEHLSVRLSYKKMQECAKTDGVDWSWTHSYFANMGGFGIDEENQFTNKLEEGKEAIQKLGLDWIWIDACFASMEGFVAQFGSPTVSKNGIDEESQAANKMEELGKEAIQRLANERKTKHKRWKHHYDDFVLNVHYFKGNEWRVNIHQLFLARELCIITNLPNISEDELEGLRKSDVVARVLTVAQITWLIIDLSLRWFKHLPSSHRHSLRFLYLGFLFAPSLHTDYNGTSQKMFKKLSTYQPTGILKMPMN